VQGAGFGAYAGEIRQKAARDVYLLNARARERVGVEAQTRHFQPWSCRVEGSEMCSSAKDGSYLRLIDFSITQL
jgi:hypothetical protein